MPKSGFGGWLDALRLSQGAQLPRPEAYESRRPGLACFCEVIERVKSGAR